MAKKLKLHSLVAATLALAGCTHASAAKDSPHVITQGTVGSVVHSPANAPGWSKVWSDEFDGERIDTSKWGYDVDCWGGGNDERQCYTNAATNSSIRDGKLVITARRAETVGPAFPPYLRQAADERDATATKPFSSARMTTKDKASWKYGWIEIRAKLPQGQGTWPAIWMLPDENFYGKWAASGEIDILEAVNLGVACKECPGGQENTILGTLHFGGQWPDNKFSSTEIAQPGSLDEFHTYSVVWTEGKMTWLIDGRVFATRKAVEWSSSGSDNPSAPFDRPFHLILNLAIGGKLAEGRGLGGVSTEDFPKEYMIDWVRVWQCDADLATGSACPIEGDQ